MKKTFFILSAAACLGFTSCKQQQQTGQAPAIRNVLQLKAEECILTKPYSSILLANGSVEVRPRVSGYIFKQHVNEGDYVKAGDLLFTIDTVQVVAEINVAKANVEAAKAQVETAQLTFDTKNELFKQQIISANDLQMAQNSLASAKAALAQCQAALVNAERNLEFCKVTSPIDGLVGIIPYSPGNLVSSTSANPLTTVTDVAKMRCYFSISEREALALSRQYGSPEEIAAALPEVELNLVDGSRYPYKGRVITVSGVPDGTTGSIRIRADFHIELCLVAPGRKPAVAAQAVQVFAALSRLGKVAPGQALPAAVEDVAVAWVAAVRQSARAVAAVFDLPVGEPVTAVGRTGCLLPTFSLPLASLL